MPRKARKDTRREDSAGGGEEAGPRSGRHLVLPLVLLVALSCGAYLNADHEEFLFDSSTITSEKRHMGDLSSTLTSLFGHPFRPGSQLTYVSFALNQALNKALGLEGFDLTTFLAFNVLVHGMNAWLVFLLLRALLGREEPGRSPPTFLPLGVAILFAVHPMHASSVAYIMQRRGLMATTFYLLGVLGYLRAREFKPGKCGLPAARGAGTLGGEPTRAWPAGRVAAAVAVPACYWMSFHSKTLGLPMPLAILALEFCLRASDRKALRRYLGWMFAGALATVVGMLVYLWSIGQFDPASLSIGRRTVGVHWGPWVHFLTESRAFIHYWKLLILPLPRWSCIDHGLALSRHLGEHYAVVAVAAQGALLAAAVMAARRGYAVAAGGVFWFYVALIPYVVLPQSELLVEYKTYLPSVGLSMILADVLARVRHRVPFAWQASVVVLLAGALLITTVRRNVIYQSTLNLWTDAVRKSPSHYRAYSSLGMALSKLGRYEEAVAALETSLRLNPESPKAHNNLGVTLKKQGRLNEAMAHYAEALRLNPLDAEAHCNLGVALKERGELEAAMGHYTEALRLDPELAEAHTNLGSVLFLRGRFEEAARSFREAVRLRPDLAMAHNNLAAALVELRRYEQAARHAREAVRLRPELAMAHLNLGKALAGLGRLDEAIAEFREVLRIDPQHVMARQRLETAESRRSGPPAP